MKKKLKEMSPDIHGVDGMLFFRRHQTFYVLPEKKQYKWTYLQNRKWLKDLENELMVADGKG